MSIAVLSDLQLAFYEADHLAAGGGDHATFVYSVSASMETI